MEKYRASSAQKRMYIINELRPTDLAYNVSFQIRIDGEIDTEQVLASVKKVVAKNDLINSHFYEYNQELFYSFDSNRDVEVEMIESPMQNSYNLLDWIEQKKREFIQPFLMKEGNLYRIAYCKISDELHYLFFDFHHSVFDGNSIAVLCTQISQCYNSNIEPRKDNYSSFVKWQECKRDSIEYSSSEQYWRELCENTEYAKLNVQLNVNKGVKKSNCQVYSIPESKRIIEFCNEVGCSRYSFFASCISLLIYQLTGEKNVMVGSVTKENKYHETTQDIGMFVNTFPIITKIDPELKIDVFFSKAYDNIRKSLKNSNVPFERIVELLMGDDNQTSLFDVLFRYQKDFSNSFKLSSAKSTVTEILPLEVDFNLYFYINEDAEANELIINYNNVIYQEENIKKIADKFIQIILKVLDYQTMKIKDVRWVSEIEQNMIDEFNSNKQALPQIGVIERFEKCVKSSPNSIAIKSENTCYSYQQLNNMVNHLAIKMESQGVKKGDRVAIYMNRSIEFIISIYAVLKMGAIYVPISYEYPMERIEYIIDDCKARIVLTKGDHTLDGQDNIIVDDVIENANKKIEFISSINDMDDICSILYTSGTTGKPKGVMNKHRGLINILQFMQKKYPLCETDCILQKTAITFDVAGTEFFWWSQVGASVYILKDNAEKDPSLIYDTIVKERISMVNFVPSMLNVFLDFVVKRQKQDSINIKYVFSAGEELGLSIVKKFYHNDLLGDTKLVNLYGPTEASIYVTYFAIHKDCRRVYIGKPVDNVNIQIMRDGILCGIDEPGELCITGDALAEGYLNLQELTKEKFVDDPFGKGKMYKTGDIASWTREGNILYLGRIDDQVKVRGFRIELGDIENAMSRLKGVKECVAIIRENENKDKAIHAYYTAEETFRPLDMRNHLRNILPFYMIPTYLMQLDSLPISVNGKISKKNLPVIQMACKNDYIAPRTQIENSICKVFGEILRISKIGILDSFIELGGDSIKAVRACIGLKEVGIYISVLDIMNMQTPEKIAQAYNKSIQTENYSLQKCQSKRIFDMSYKQAQIFKASLVDDTGIAYNMPHAYIVDKKIDTEKLNEAFIKVISDSKIFRLSFGIKEDKLCQWENNKKRFEIQIKDNSDDKEVDALFREFVAPFNLEEDMLIRVQIIKDNSRYLLFVDIHHIISDGISYSVLMNKIVEYYNSNVVKKEEFNYLDYSEWSNSRSSIKEKEYWEKVFDSEVDSLRFPTNFSRSNKQNYLGHSVECKLSNDIIDQLSHVTQNGKFTEYVVLCGVFGLLLSKYSLQTDLVFSTSMEGRQMKNIQDMLGVFVNTVLLRIRVDELWSLEHYFEYIKEVVFSAMDNQEYPLEQITEMYNKKGYKRKNSLFDVMFTYQNYDDSILYLDGEELVELPMKSLSSKFDFELEVNKLNDSISVKIEYNSSLFNSEFMEQVLNDYCDLVLNICKECDLTSRNVLDVTSKKPRLNNVIWDEEVRENERETDLLNTKLPNDVKNVFEEVLNCTVEAQSSFIELGGDSIKAIRIVSKLKLLGYQIKVADILTKIKIGSISFDIKQNENKRKYLQKEYKGKILPAPMQSFFFNNFRFNKPEQYNQSMLLHLSEINSYAINKALKALAIHHDILRLVCRDKEMHVLSVKESKLFNYFEENIVSEKNPVEYIMEDSLSIYQNVDLDEGPIMNCKLYKSHSGDYLLVCIHHLAVDEVSWNILLEDLCEGYKQALQNKRNHLPEKTAAFSEWTRLIDEHREKGINSDEIQYWNKAVKSIKDNSFLYQETNCEKTNIKVEINQDCTEKLLNNCLSTGDTMQTLLLASIVNGLTDVISQKHIAIAIEGHGREELYESIDIDRTVGWFTSIYPVVFDVKDNIYDEIVEVRNKLNEVPNKGVNFSILMMDNIMEYVLPQICFNYFGNIDSERYYNPFTVVERSIGQAISSENDEGYLLEFNSQIWKGKLEINCTYSNEMVTKEEMCAILEKIKYYLISSLQFDFSYNLNCKRDYSSILSHYKKDEIKKIYPLTPLQLGMLYHHLKDDSWSYIIQELYKIPNTISVHMIKVIMDMIMNKYDILHSNFIWESVTIPYQIVKNDYDIEIKEINVTDMNDVDEYMFEDRCRGFELNNDLLWRVTILNINNQKKMLWSYHHIIADGWSSSIIYNCFMDIYSKLVEGVKPEVIYEEIMQEKKNQNDFSDYIKWINNINNDVAYKYWDDLLKDYSFSAGIPSVRKIEKQSSYEQVKYEELPIIDELYVELNNLCATEGVTLNSFMEVIWGIVLQIYNNVDDVVFGKVTSGRNAEVEKVDDIVGLLINTIPVRINNCDNASVVEMIKDNHRNSIHAMNYSFCNLSEIQRRITSDDELIVTIMDFVNYYTNNESIAHSEDILLDKYREQTNYDISFAVYEKSNHMNIKIMYNPLKYASDDITRILLYIQDIIRQIVNNPRIKVKEINRIMSFEKKQMIIKSEKIDNHFQTVDDMFYKSAFDNLDSVAIICEKREITYKQLINSVKKMAKQLEEYGEISGMIIPIISSKSENLIVSMLAVISMGASFVPIDVDTPKKRIEYIINDSDTNIVIVENSSNLDGVDINNSISVFVMSEYDNQNESIIRVQAEHKSNDLVYVIYTSGTTGNPKGVMIEHHSLVNYLEYAKENYISDKIVTPFFTNHSFDLTLTSIFLPLCYGGTLYIYNGDNYENIKNVFGNHELALIKFTPSHLNMALSLVDSNQLYNLNSLILGGEGLECTLAKKTLDHFGHHINIHNEYGPTEATIGCMDYIFDEEINIRGQVPIGKSIRNSNIYIMQDNKLCGVGVVGELCISGEGLARGYLHNDTLTEIKFEFSQEVDELIYHSGDLAVYLDDNTIHYCGRIDEQVKIRGHRVELGEIECVINELDYISDSAVIWNSEKKQLVAFLKADKKYCNKNIVKEQLRELLPEYMIPNDFIVLDQLPITKNGKVDKNAFDDYIIESSVQYIEASTIIEQMVIDVFSDVLGAQHIGLLDTFYELGGDSIKAIQVMSKIKELGFDVKINDILSSNNIKELSQYIRPLKHLSEQGLIIGSVPMTPIQKWYFDGKYCENSYWHQSVVLESEEFISKEISMQTIEELLQHHDILRTKYSFDNGIEQEILNKGKYYFNDFSKCEDIGQNNYLNEIRDELNRKIDIQQGILVSVGITNRDNEEQKSYIVFVIHHLVIDGISWRIFIEDFSKIYMSIANQQKIAISKKTDSFKKWAEVLYDYSMSEQLETEEVYWKEIQSLVFESHEISALPLHKKDLEKYSCYLNEEYTSAILKKVHKKYGTQINDIILSAVGLAYMNVFKSNKISVCMEGHGREQITENIDVSRTIGCFTSQFPIVLDIVDDIEEMICLTKESIRRIPMKGIGFGILKYIKYSDTYINSIFNANACICVNYLGEFGNEISNGMFKTVSILDDEDQSADFSVDFPLSVDIIVNEGKMCFNYFHDVKTISSSIMSDYAKYVIYFLEKISDLCDDSPQIIKTPSDYCDDRMTVDELRLLDKNYNHMDKIYSMSPIQLGMYFHYLCNGATSYYFEQLQYTLLGYLDVDKFVEAFGILAEENEILRTVYYSESLYEPKQIVLNRNEIPVEIINAEGVNKSEISKHIEEIRINEKKKDYSLDKQPPMRICIVQYDNLISKVLISFHHIMLDAWSLDILFDNFSKIYCCLCNDIEYHSQKSSYIDYTKWVYNRLNLINKSDISSLFDGYEDLKKIEPVERGDQRTTCFTLNSSFTNKMIEFSNKNNVTIYSIISAVLASIYMESSNVDTILFGCVVTGRTIDVPNIESMVGMFVNTIPVLVSRELNGNEMINKVQNTIKILSDKSYLSLSDILEQTNLKTDNLDFVINFSESAKTRKESRNSNIQVTDIKFYEQANYYLYMDIEIKDEIVVNIMHDSNRFSDNDIQMFNKQFSSTFELLSNDNIDLSEKSLELDIDFLF